MLTTICPDQGPSRAPRAACVSTWLGETTIADNKLDNTTLERAKAGQFNSFHINHKLPYTAILSTELKTDQKRTNQIKDVCFKVMVVPIGMFDVMVPLFRARTVKRAQVARRCLARCREAAAPRAKRAARLLIFD